MTSNVCTSWADLDDLNGCQNCPNDPDPYVMADLLLAASSMLNKKIGGLYPGTCSEYSRPCSQFGNTGWPAFHGEAWWAPGWWSWIPAWGVCGCAGLASRECGCCGIPEVMPGAGPIAEIQQIKIDGVVLAPSAYQIADDNYIARIDGGTFPCCQNHRLADTEPDTFSISYTAGADPPIEATMAAASLACDLYSACTGGECAIPIGVASLVREQVSYSFAITELNALQAGFTGNRLADLFLATYGKAPSEAEIWSPGMTAVRRPRQ